MLKGVIMPIYKFQNTETKEQITKFLNISELDNFKAENPHLQIQLASPPLGDPMRLGRMRPSEDFNSLLKGVKKKHPGSTVETW